MTYLLATTLLLVEIGAATPPAAPETLDLAGLTQCEDSLDIGVFNSPRAPHVNAPLRVLIVSDEDLGPARVVVVDPAGVEREVPSRATGGPPWGWVAEVKAPAPGRWRMALVTASGVVACQDTTVRRAARGSNALDEGGPVWSSRIKWERDTENLYSLWVEHLFDAPVDVDVSWNPLHEVLRDRDRNLLFDHLGLGEDRGGKGALRLDPDCADFPYFLRAYFAWKLHLPFAYRPCRRGNAKRAPTCGDMLTNEEPAEGATRLAAFATFMRKVKGTVHSSSMRGLPEDEQSDFYPVALHRRGLRPGTIYTDPYGHTMLVSRWYPQADGRAGVLMATDAQPDGQIGRRIFWRGSFMFPEDDALAGAGWKRFRPVRKVRGGEHVALSNAEIAASVDYGDFSLDQWSHGKDGFYEKMDEVINPEPLAPERALIATIDALDQQVRRRVESVDNGEDWKRKNRGRTMPMPDGTAIFLTAGPWEDFSTPSRDMRLLIAMDTVSDFPSRVVRRPERFALGGEAPAAARERLERLLRDEVARRTVQYRRSDGSPWTLSLGDVLDRRVGFEMAYNPNDCAEVRWAAPEGSEELSTCDGRAPEAHRAKMATYRPWFQKRERPLQ